MNIVHLRLRHQNQARCGYPTRRVPDPEKPNRKRTFCGRHLERYTMKADRLMVLHATKGWRIA